MKHLALLRLLFVISTGYACIPACFAAQDGYLRESRSEGSIRISLAILPSLQISVVNQINVDIRDVTVDSNFGEYVCITGHEGGRYQLIATGSSGGFVLNTEGGELLPYSVFYNGTPLGSSFDELQAGTPSPTYNLLADSSQCASTPNFRITFASQDLRDATSGLYKGSLTLLVSPL